MSSPNPPLPNHAPASPAAPLRLVIYCHVVDNYGDAGVCWRLARQLAGEHGARVTLCIDRLDALRAIVPDAAADATICGVTIRVWPAGGTAGSAADRAPDVAPDIAPDVVVSAFGCDLPAEVRAALAPHALAPHALSGHALSGHALSGHAVSGHAPSCATPAPLWVNLEYLSAEPWVDGCHGLESVKPGDGAVEHFFYPGFTPATGGLLREHGLIAARERFVESRAAPQWLEQRGLAPAPGQRLISLFCYPDATLDGWLLALSEAAQPSLVLVPAGIAEPALLRFLGGRLAGGPGAQVTRGALTVKRFAWLAQDDYDRLLWSCDLNVVRGEDSWIRAHWADRPFLWQPYPQQDGAHFAKLDAFIGRFEATACAPAAAGELMRALSGRGDAYLAARRHAAHFDDLRRAHRVWTEHLAAQTDLATSLIEFCRARL